MNTDRDVLVEREIEDKPPRIESEDEEATPLNQPTSKNNNSTNEESVNELSADDPLANDPLTNAAAAIEEYVQLKANPSTANDAADDDTSANDSSTNNFPEEDILADGPSANGTLEIASSTNDISSDGSSTIATQIPEIRMNANESRRSDEYLKEEKSDIFIGKADLNLTEGALSLDELEDNLVRLSWRPKPKTEQETTTFGYIIESKTKSGFWRKVCQVSSEKTEVVFRVEEDDLLKFRIKAAKIEATDAVSESKTDSDSSRKMAQRGGGGGERSKASSPLPASSSGSSEEVALPAWKQKLIEKKMELKKQKDEEEEAARRKWSELPDWKRTLLETKGKICEDFNVAEKEGEVTGGAPGGTDYKRESPSREQESDGVESGDDAGDDNASVKSAGFWGVTLRKQRSESKSASKERAEEEEEEEEAGGRGGGGKANYKDGAKRLWGVSLKVTEKGESPKDENASD